MPRIMYGNHPSEMQVYTVKPEEIMARTQHFFITVSEGYHDPTHYQATHIGTGRRLFVPACNLHMLERACKIADRQIKNWSYLRRLNHQFRGLHIPKQMVGRRFRRLVPRLNAVLLEDNDRTMAAIDATQRRHHEQK